LAEELKANRKMCWQTQRDGDLQQSKEIVCPNYLPAAIFICNGASCAIILCHSSKLVRFSMSPSTTPQHAFPPFPLFLFSSRSFPSSATPNNKKLELTAATKSVHSSRSRLGMGINIVITILYSITEKRLLNKK